MHSARVRKLQANQCGNRRRAGECVKRSPMVIMRFDGGVVLGNMLLDTFDVVYAIGLIREQHNSVRVCLKKSRLARS